MNPLKNSNFSIFFKDVVLISFTCYRSIIQELTKLNLYKNGRGSKKWKLAWETRVDRYFLEYKIELIAS